MSSVELSHPPVIDLANFEERRSEIVQELMDAATVVGFFYIRNHEIPQDLIDAAFGQAERQALRNLQFQAYYSELLESVTLSAAWMTILWVT